jgi:hypothetical protein
MYCYEATKWEKDDEIYKVYVKDRIQSSNGSINKFKVCLITKGWFQACEINFDETYVQWQSFILS